MASSIANSKILGPTLHATANFSRACRICSLMRDLASRSWLLVGGVGVQLSVHDLESRGDHV